MRAKSWNIWEFSVFWTLAVSWFLTGYLALALHNQLLPKLYGICGLIYLAVFFYQHHFDKGELLIHPKKGHGYEWIWLMLLAFPYPFILYYQDWRILILFATLSFGWLYVKKILKEEKHG